MNCVLDNVVFSLQRAGGISVVWKEHIERLLRESEVNVEFIEYDNAKNNLFRKSLDIPPQSIISKPSSLLFLKRYFDLHSKEFSKYIFHSSYFRLNTNPNALNITTVHDFTYEYFAPTIRKFVHATQKWNAIKKADAIICVSDSTKQDLLKFIPKVDESKISVIHNGVGPAYRRLTPLEYMMSLPYKDGEYILYVGSRLTPYKNFKVVVEVCSTLHLPLVIVGGEPMSISEKLDLDKRLGKNNYFHYMEITDFQLNELYNRASFFLYPSKYEGFGIPVVEAQKAGCVVIAYSKSSIPEVMKDSKYALADISCGSILEAIRYLMNHSNEWNNEVKKGLENSNRFSWDITYKKTMDLYKQVYYNIGQPHQK